MKVILVSDRTEFAVAEEADQADGTKGVDDFLGIVMGGAKEALAPPVTCAEEAAQDSFGLGFEACLPE